MRGLRKEYGAIYGKIEAQAACDQSRMVQSVRHLRPFLSEEGSRVGRMGQGHCRKAAGLCLLQAMRNDVPGFGH